MVPLSPAQGVPAPPLGFPASWCSGGHQATELEGEAMVHIQHRLTNAVLFEHAGDSVKEALIAAVSADAYLADAYLAGAYLADANGVIDAGTPNGWRCVGWLQDGWLAIRVGCHNKRLVEARTYWMGKENRREVAVALEYIFAVASIRGWATEQPAELANADAQAA